MAACGLWGSLDWTYILKVILTLVHGGCKVFAGAPDGTKCYKDEELADFYSINVYYCKEPGKPSCCTIDYEPTCCEDEGTRKLKEQMQLWGTIVAVAVVVAIIVICYRKDTHCCTGERSLKERIKACCRCNKQKKEDMAVLDDINEEPSSSGSTPAKYTNQSKLSQPGHSYSQNGGRGPNNLDNDDYDSGRGSVLSVTSPGASPIGSPETRDYGAAFVYANRRESVPDERRGPGIEMTEDNGNNKKSKRKGKSGKRKRNKQKMNEDNEEGDISL